MAARKTGKKVMTKAQKAILRAKSGAAVTKKEMKRFRAAASVVGGSAGAKAGTSIGKLHKGKVGKLSLRTPAQLHRQRVGMSNARKRRKAGKGLQR